MCLELGLQPEYVRCQIGLGQTLLQVGREAEADELFGQASGLCRSMGMSLPDIRFDRMAHLN